MSAPSIHSPLRKAALVMAALLLIGTTFVPTAEATIETFVLPIGPSPAGNPSGEGVAVFDLDDVTGEVCFTMILGGLSEVTNAHIHSGTSTQSGPPVIFLDPVTNGLDACVMADVADVQNVIATPSSFYVNIHTDAYPAGAIRGQMHQKPICQERVATVVPGLFGMAGPDTDTIYGTPADDTIIAMGGDDYICGNGGNDIIKGGPGVDRIFGGDGDDTINAGGANDFVFGEGGNDHIRGQGGSDILSGGTGDDKIEGQGAADEIFGDAGDDIIDGQNGADDLRGSDGNDTIKGQTGPDRIFGGDGNDELFGGNGNDELWGEEGVDKCAGNLGGGDRAHSGSCEKAPGVEELF